MGSCPNLESVCQVFYVPRHVTRELKVFIIKFAVWCGVAGLVWFVTTTLLDGAPPYLVPGIFLAGAIHLGLLDRSSLPGEGGGMLKRGAGLLLLTLGIWLATDGGAGEKIAWQTYSEEMLTLARQQRQPVMIDFRQETCSKCKAMERNVFTTHKVAEAAAPFLALRVDLTADTPGNRQLGERYCIKAFPTVVFLGPDGTERSNLRLVGYEPPAFFAARVDSAR